MKTKYKSIFDLRTKAVAKLCHKGSLKIVQASFNFLRVFLPQNLPILK